MHDTANRAKLPSLVVLFALGLALNSRAQWAMPNYAVSIAPPNQYVSVTFPGGVGLNNNYTICAWVYIRNGAAAYDPGTAILSSTVCGGTTELILRGTQASPQVIELGRCDAFAGVLSTNSVYLGAWAHVAVTVSAANLITYYINGVPAGSWTTANTVALGSTVLIGANSSFRQFDGLLDEVQIWQGVRTPAQIQAGLFHNLAGNESGLLVYYRFDEASGATAVNGATIDAGHANGILTNGASRVLSSLPTQFATAATLPASLSTAADGTLSAMLNASVNDGNFPSTAWFQWGLTTNYGNLAPVPGLPVTNVTQNASALLTGLNPSGYYHCRIVVSNAATVALGADSVFWAPLLSLNGSNPLTNECHAPYIEAGAGASASPQLIACGYFDNLALRADGTHLAVWGDNAYGQTSISAGLSNFTAISVGNFNWLALRSNGTVLAVGRDRNGQSSGAAGVSGAVGIADGTYHGVALKSDGTVVAWGDTTYSQTTVPASATNVTAVSAGNYHSVALRSNGTVVAWGAGTTVNPGDFTDFGQSIVPAGATNVVAISAGDYHNLALRADGSVIAWGAGTTYNPGDLADLNQSIVPASATNVIAIAAGSLHSLALRAGGTLVAGRQRR